MIPAVVNWVLLIYAAQGGDVGDDDLVMTLIQEVISGTACEACHSILPQSYPRELNFQYRKVIH